LTSDNSREVFKELEDKYKEQLKYQADERARAEAVSIDLRVKLSNLEAQVKALKESEKPVSGPAAKAGSY
jgi:hypothetical protein